MGVGSAVRRFRRRDRAQWHSEGRLTRASTDEPEFDDDTGLETPADPTLIYEGPCQVRSSSATGRRDVQAGEREVRIASLEAKFPVDTGAQVDDVLTITSSRFDAGLVGRVFRVTVVLWDDWQIARVAILEEVTP